MGRRTDIRCGEVLTAGGGDLYVGGGDLEAGVQRWRRSASWVLVVGLPREMRRVEAICRCGGGEPLGCCGRRGEGSHARCGEAVANPSLLCSGVGVRKMKEGGRYGNKNEPVSP
jgi:hypothetical protein